MIRVTQDKFGKEEGNCFSACLASLLELPLSEVPFFWGEGAAMGMVRVNEWLRPRGLRYGEFETGRPLPAIRDCLCILVGPGPRGMHHAIVGHIALSDDGTALTYKAVHDPHPSRAGLLAVELIGVLVWAPRQEEDCAP